MWFGAMASTSQNSTALPASCIVAGHPGEVDDVSALSESRVDRQPTSSAFQQRRRRARVSFNTMQVDTLETRFKKQRYINNSERQQLAMKLGLSDTQVRGLAFLMPQARLFSA